MRWLHIKMFKVLINCCGSEKYVKKLMTIAADMTVQTHG